MKNYLTILVVGFTLISCSKQKQKYEYEVLKDNRMIDSGTIETETDSSAYMKAYKMYLVRRKSIQRANHKVNSEMSVPNNFLLYNEQGIEISKEITFSNMDSLKDELFTRIEGLGLGEKYIPKEDKSKKVDSVAIAKLKPYFYTKKDEFDPKGLVWYKPKNAPKYVNSNSIYFYFQAIEGKSSNLRLKLQYHAEDWLFIKKVQFLIDGKAFEFIPTETETDSGNGGKIWEWIDEDISKNYPELLQALYNAKNAKMKLIGSQYHKVKPITKTQITYIKRSIDLYKAMGGGKLY
jgi:hypothetical protein